MLRIDKLIWMARLAKTRSIASRLCSSGQVRIENNEAKPSKSITKGDVFQIRNTPIWRSYKVLELPKSRLSAKLVPEFFEETTSESDLEQMKQVEKINRQNRLQGNLGRPTKKSRRDIDKFNENTSF